MNVVSALKWFHNWIGFIVTITMLIVLSTGVYLGAMDIIKRMDNKGQTYTPMTIAQKAATVEAVFERYPKMSTVRFPTEHTPFVEAATRGKTISLDNDLNEIGVRSMKEMPFYSTVFWLHRNFLMNDFGKYTNAWASLLGALVTLVGIYLWWRVRNGFRLKQSLPKDTRSSSLLKSHIQLGLFISIPLFVLCISGFLITYKSLWYGALTHKPTEQVQYPVTHDHNWASQLQLAQQYWPESQLVAVSKPRVRKAKEGDAQPTKPQDLVYSVRFDEHSDVWLRQADSISINYNTGAMTAALKHSDRAISGKVASFVRPLHDALNMPLKYVVFITFVSIVGTLILLFSAVTFYRRIFGSRKRALKS
ncbi:PepSY-associated TM helix domain-containing protein [Shewanella intestini]|uniref:PepSY domain-containing protein n=1 Tax=Shewanella intestini TaxID=2017544 RepID=A0ABS5I226_9GAMM|nr:MULTISPECIES: PepSY-associated TM helix domain-containing protein [Shewanella]MBR9728063.1 PepSY domain-containing protein [Shewanella intestini]MRG36535.1 hypothetical protein [Shewanella sp. XMDDZSB0408]